MALIQYTVLLLSDRRFYRRKIYRLSVVFGTSIYLWNKLRPSFGQTEHAVTNTSLEDHTLKFPSDPTIYSRLVVCMCS
jgi:hypothetical protein